MASQTRVAKNDPVRRAPAIAVILGTGLEDPCQLTRTFEGAVLELAVALQNSADSV